ncbi:MAG: UbiA prenyltransferase family protein [Defluviitaleaceae bacterium]|nr:UbiA prenyltransferase family protein [Defluviitaleaceae bacterium]
MMVENFIQLMRPKHFLKNVLIFVPVVYSFNLTNTDMLLSVFICFVGLCFIASGVYAINDIADYEKDKAHPKNRTRPIAAGKISKTAAAWFALFLFASGFALIAVFGGELATLFAALYVLLNLAYSFKLKHMAVIDCFCIAGGFVLRIYIGGAAIGGEMYVVISEWLFLTITAVSLFLAFGKRRGELLQLGISSRKVLGGYNMEFLTSIVFSCAAISIVFYALWAMAGASPMIYTVPLVIFIVCKYLLNISDAKSYGDPITIIFSDRLLIGALIIFGALSLVFLYGV